MFGIRLKELRQKKQLTQEQLAEIMGLATRTISSWEVGDRKPTIDTVIWLSKFYAVSSDYLLALTDDPIGYDPTMKINEKPPTPKEDERPEEDKRPDDAKDNSFKVQFPVDGLPKDPQELARALEPILEPIVRRIVDQLQGRNPGE